jgi:amino acid adenylation domain-containing protein
MSGTSTFIPRSQLPPEQEAIRAKCSHPSGTFVEFRKEEIEQSITERFEKIVSQYPERIAINAKTQTLTFDALNKAANHVAWTIYDHFGGQSEPIMLLCEHGAAAIVSCLSILKSGKFFLAVDPSYPLDRIAHIFEDSKAQTILTDSKHLSLAKELTNARGSLINVDVLANDILHDNLCLPISPDHPAQIVYTSGSTGQPKGLLRNHRRLLHSTMILINGGRICPDERILALHNLGFAAGIGEILKGLLSGATVFPFDIKKEGVSVLADYILQHGITYFASSPSTFRYFINELSENQIFPSVRLIAFTGERLSSREVNSYKRHFSDQCLLVNRLANSETGTLCRYFIDKQTQITTGIVPVGYAVDDKEVLLIDDAGKEAGVNQVGEIVVRCHYFMPEYWNCRESTNLKFLPDPRGGDQVVFCTGDLGRMLPDGCLIYLGRKDFEVKIRGYKVALTEIEIALEKHPNVSNAAVVAWDREDREQYLAAYVVLRDNQKLTITELRSFLQDNLADYMIPSIFMFLDSLPLANGKLDRKALPKPDDIRPNLSQQYVHSRNEIEQSLVRIWEELLKVHPVGVHDNFFDLGGHSLLLSAVHNKLRGLSKQDISIIDVLSHPTISSLARFLSKGEIGWTSAQGLERAESRRANMGRHKQFRREHRAKAKQSGDGDE